MKMHAAVSFFVIAPGVQCLARQFVDAVIKLGMLLGSTTKAKEIHGSAPLIAFMELVTEKAWE